MSQYKRWQMLNESLGYPLGITSLASLGVVGSETETLEEKKGKKKKMLAGDEISVDADEDDEDVEDVEDEDDVDIDDSDDDGPDSGGGKCHCNDPEAGEKKPFMCKKCGKYMKKGMKKKGMKKESVLDQINKYNTFSESPEVGTEEYRSEFWKSLQGFENPNPKFSSGIELGEEVVFTPTDNNSQLASEPTPGEPGFAPQQPVGGMIGATSAGTDGGSDWESGWTQVKLENISKQLSEIQKRLNS